MGLSSLHFIFPRTLNAEKEVIRRPIANRVHGNLTPAGYSAGSVEKYHYTPKPVVAVSVAARYFRMVSGSLSTFCPADTVSGRWVLAYLHLAVGSRNVSDECVFGFQGSRKAHRLLTFSLPNFFARFPHFFKKIFCAGSRKQKSAHCTCLVGVVSAKNKTR